MTFEAFFMLFGLLLAAHALADYPLQGEFIGIYKSRHVQHPHIKERYLWVHLLTAHSLIHAGFVGLITGSLALAWIELVLHWLIDLAKNEKQTNFHQDQALHVLCKLIYCTLIFLGMLAKPWWL